MPPKKRGRKPGPKPKPKAPVNETFMVVPPKKRKTYAEFKTAALPIPEWLKVSVQILLINFHNEGVALLNSIQSEYEAVFKDHKVNPGDFGFQDWESMLRSPQFKQHCFVYTEKKMPCVKGYPLPRSAGMQIRFNRWEITPQIQPFQQSENPPMSIMSIMPSTASASTISELESMEYKSDEKSEDVPKKYLKTSDSPKSDKYYKDYAEQESDNEGNITNAGGNDENTEEIRPKTPEEEENGPKTPESETPGDSGRTTPELKAMPKLNPVVIIERISSPEVEMANTNSNEADALEIDIPQESTETPSNIVDSPGSEYSYSYYPSGRKRRHASFDQSTFFISSKAENEPKKSSEKARESESQEIETDQNLATDGPKTPPDSAQSPETDCGSPPLPTLAPIESFQHKKKVKSRDFRPEGRGPKKRYLSNKGLSNSKPRHFSVRRISESTDSNCNSVPNSPKNTDLSPSEHTHRNGKPLVETLSPWRFIPLLFPNQKSPLAAFEQVPKINTNALVGTHHETTMHEERDPRLNFELRKLYFPSILGLENGLKSLNRGNNETPEPTETNAIGNRDSTAILPLEETETELPFSMPTVNISPDQPNLKITITQEPLPPRDKEIIQTQRLAKEQEPLEIPRRKATSAASLKRFNETNAIPQDDFNHKNLRFSDLWNETKWKHRFDQDDVAPSRFFKSNIYERWREAFRINLSQNRQEYMKELQIYEEKPYPSRQEFFLRSALRMIEIDYLTDYQFSEPRTPDGEQLVRPHEVLYYVDFAGAPGGVIEFYNKRRRWGSKGFGITYQKRSYDLYAIPEAIPEYFEAFYGKLNSLSGDGNLYCKDTVKLFVSRVLEATKGKGVHVVTTVGNVARITFEDDNDEKWKYQHLAQIMVALMVLREGGNMAFKMYDIKSSFVAGLLYILYRSFHYVQISKLHIFGPGSSERVVICIGKRGDSEVAEIIKFLQECHKVMAEWYLRDKFTKNKRTIEEIIPLSTMEKSVEFMKYLKDSNERLKRAQLEEFLVMMKNIRTQGCIFSKGTYRALIAKTTELWNVGNRPSHVRKPQKNPTAAFKELHVYPEDVCEAVETMLNEYNLYTIFASAQQWRFIPIGNQSRTRGFYMGVEGFPYFFNMKLKEWLLVRDYEFRLPSRTLVYAEIVSVFTEDKDYGEDLFTIIDAIELAGQDVRNFPYAQRILECEKFGTAVTKTFFPRMTRFTVTQSYDFGLLPEFLQKIEATQRSLKAYGHGGASTDVGKKILVLSADSVFSNGHLKDGKQCWFNPSGVLFFEADHNNKSTDFCASLFSRVYWEWVSEMDLPLAKLVLSPTLDPKIGGSGASGNITNGDETPIGSVSAKKLIDFVNRYSE